MKKYRVFLTRHENDWFDIEVEDDEEDEDVWDIAEPIRQKNFRAFDIDEIVELEEGE